MEAIVTIVYKYDVYVPQLHNSRVVNMKNELHKQKLFIPS